MSVGIGHSVKVLKMMFLCVLGDFNSILVLDWGDMMRRGIWMVLLNEVEIPFGPDKSKRNGTENSFSKYGCEYDSSLLNRNVGFAI